jgi:hypothetical protein
MRIFPKAANLAKKVTLKEIFFRNILLGSGSTVMGAKGKIERFDLKQHSLGRGSNKLVFHAPSS